MRNLTLPSPEASKVESFLRSKLNLSPAEIDIAFLPDGTKTGEFFETLVPSPS
jgi:hypothetical protein